MDNDDITALIDGFGVAMCFRLGSGAFSLHDIKIITEKLGKVHVNIGDGLSFLHTAVQYNKLDVMKYLIEKDHPLETKTVHGETPLDQAAWQGNINAAMFLLEAGANVDSQTNLGYTPLHRCAYYNHPRLAALFTLAGASRTVRDFVDQETPYEVAVKQENDKVAKILEPIYVNGLDISDEVYASNNPNNPKFQPSAREAFFRLYKLEQSFSPNTENDEVEDEENGDQGKNTLRCDEDAIE